MFLRTLRRLLACGAALATLVALLVAIGGAAAPASAATPPRLRHDGDRATFSVVGQGRVRITARAARCQGYPVMRVWIDGKLDRTVRTTSRSSRTYLSAKSYAAGRHRVTVILRRDKKVSRHGKVVCNRAVRIMAVSIPRAPAPRVTSAPTPLPADQPGDGDGQFTIAVIGDTQAEVLPYAGGRFSTKTAWLADHAAAEDIRFVIHTGDMVNWGWLDPSQYTIAKTAMGRLTAAGIPWQASIGNHDTRAVGVGGSAYAPLAVCKTTLGDSACRTADLLRETDEFNDAFPAADQGRVAGAFEAGRVDNTYSTFSAAGRDWLVLNLEYYPRASVVAWANRVVKAHADHDVIVQTHSYLSGSGAVGAGGTGGDSTSPALLKRDLIDPNPNIKLVVSGHTGLVAHRRDETASGVKVSFLGNEYKANAVSRLIHISPATGKVSSEYWIATQAERDAGINPLTREPDGVTLDAGFRF